MPTTLSAIAPTLFSAAKEVAAEAFGAVRAVNTSFDNKGVALGDFVDVPVQSAGAAKDFTPGIVNTTSQTLTASKISVAITKQRKYDMTLTGEQIRSLENGGTYQDWATQFFKNAARVLRNEMEADCVAAIKVGASRAVGTSGTNPFASNTDLIADARKVMIDNGAPMSDATLLMGTAASNAMQKLGIYNQAYQAGSDAERRAGSFGNQYGFKLSESAAVGIHTKGTGSGYLINGTLAVGATALTVDTGTGTILAGDVITIAGDTNQYVVVSALSGGTVTIGAPGLLVAPADDAPVTVTNNYTSNLFLERSAVVGVVRPPLIPAKSDMMQQIVTDEMGMTYLLVDEVQYGQRVWELHAGWGFKSVNGFQSGVLKG